jgi:hypothetical protein
VKDCFEISQIVEIKIDIWYNCLILDRIRDWKEHKVGSSRIAFLVSWFRWKSVRLVCRPLYCLLYLLRMTCVFGGMRVGRGNRSTWRKPASAPLSTTNPTWTDLGLKPGRACGDTATNCLRYGTALDVFSFLFRFLVPELCLVAE